MPPRPVFKPLVLNDPKLDRLQDNLAQYLEQLDDQVAGVVSPLALPALRDAQVTDQVLVDYRGPGGHTITLPFANANGKGKAVFVHVLNNGLAPITIAAARKDTIGGAKLLALAKDSAFLGMGNGDTRWTPLTTAVAGPTVLLVSNYWYSIADSGAQNGTRSVGGNFTTGQQFVPSRALSCTGVRFYWKSAGSAKVVRCKLWIGTSVSAAVSVDVNVDASGIYVGSFATPVTLTPYMPTQATVRETTGSFYTDMGVFVAPGNGNVVKGQISTSPYTYATFFTRFVAGDASPGTNAANEVYPVEPVIATYQLE